MILVLVILLATQLATSALSTNSIPHTIHFDDEFNREDDSVYITSPLTSDTHQSLPYTSEGRHLMSTMNETLNMNQSVFYYSSDNETLFKSGIHNNRIIEMTADLELTSQVEVSAITYLTINGNGHVVDGKHMTRCFNIMESHFIVINDLTIINGRVPDGSAGGGIFIQRTNISMFYVHVLHCYTQYSGAGIYINGGVIQISSSMFENNTAQASIGGGICAVNGYVDMSNCSFNQNRASDGGGLAVSTSVTFVRNCTFYNNTAEYGGGMFSNDQYFITLITDCYFNQNLAHKDGGGAFFVYTGSSFTVAHSAFSHNNALNDGGGLSIQQSNSSVFHCQFLNNTAVNGGGLHVFKGTSTLTQSSFKSNSAAAGGGLYLNTLSAECNGLSLQNNLASRDGGGVYVKNVQGSITSSMINNNTASVDGGGMYVIHALTQLLITDKCELSFNKAIYGAGLYVLSGDVEVSGQSVLHHNKAVTPTFIETSSDTSTDDLYAFSYSFNDLSYTGNEPVTNDYDCLSYSVGGCLYSANYPGVYPIPDRCTFIVQGDGVLSAEFFDLAPGAGSLTIDGVGYLESVGPNQVSVQSGSEIVWKALTQNDGYTGFEICFADLGSGGGVYVRGGELILTSIQLNDNEATQFGGAIYVGGGAVTASDISFRNNVADAEGEEIYAEAGTISAVNLVMANITSYTLGGSSSQSVSCISNCSVGEGGECTALTNGDACFVNCLCETCKDGSHCLFKGSTSSSIDCIPCGSGKYSTDGEACQSCSVGRFASKYANDTLGGQVSQVFSAATRCNACPASYFAAYSESVVCQACQSPRDSSSGASSCSEAVAGFYVDPLNTEIFEVCPTGSKCSGGGILPMPLAHYWTDRSSLAYVSHPYECDRNTCKGVGDSSTHTNISLSTLNCWTKEAYTNQSFTEVSSSSDMSYKTVKCDSDQLQCSQGARCARCGSCMENYRFSSVSLKCEACSQEATAYIIPLVLLLLVFSYLVASSFGLISLPRFILESYVVTSLVYLKDNGGLTILVSTYQIIHSVTFSLNVNYPSPFPESLTWLSFLSLDIEGLECGGVGVLDRVMIISTAPIVLAMVISAVGFWQYTNAEQKLLKLKIKSKFSWYVLILSYVVLPPVIQKQLSSLDCFQLSQSGRSFLRLDSCVNCESDRYQLFIIIDSLFLVIYFSIPLLWVVVLWYHKKSLFPFALDKTASSARSYSLGHLAVAQSRMDEELLIVELRGLDAELFPLKFLFTRYRPQFAYWEAGDMFRRILLTGVIPLLSTSASVQCTIGLAFSLTFLLVYRELSPYFSDNTNTISYIANLVIFLVYAGSMLIDVGLARGHTNNLLFGLIMCLVNATLICAALFIAVYKSRLEKRTLKHAQSKYVQTIQWGGHFDENEFSDMFKEMKRNIPTNHEICLWFGSLQEAKSVLQQGLSCKDNGLNGLVFTTNCNVLKLSQEEKAIFLVREACLVFALPKSVLLPYKKPPEAQIRLSSFNEKTPPLTSEKNQDPNNRHSVSNSSNSRAILSPLVLLPKQLLHAMRSEHSGDLSDVSLINSRVLVLPPHCCIKAAFQLEAVANSKEDDSNNFLSSGKQTSVSGMTSNPFNFELSTVSSSFASNNTDADIELELQLSKSKYEYVKYASSDKGSNILEHGGGDTKSSSIMQCACSLKHIYSDKLEAYAQDMKLIREKCDSLGLVPVYHYTAARVAPLLLKYGIPLQHSDQGGGVLFSTRGPVAYGFGDKDENYYNNLLSETFTTSCIHSDVEDIYELMNVCLVYGMEPNVVNHLFCSSLSRQTCLQSQSQVKEQLSSSYQSINVPVEYFELFNLPRTKDQRHFLRKDLIFGCFALMEREVKSIVSNDKNQVVLVKKETSNNWSDHQKLFSSYHQDGSQLVDQLDDAGSFL